MFSSLHSAILKSSSNNNYCVLLILLVAGLADGNGTSAELSYAG